jgi:hypothetical protein
MAPFAARMRESFGPEELSEFFVQEKPSNKKRQLVIKEILFIVARLIISTLTHPLL